MPKIPFDREAFRRRTQEAVAAILKRKKVDLAPQDIKDGTSLTVELGIDSLDILQLLATLEKEYGLKIPEAEIRGMDDLKGVLAALEKNWPK